MCTSPEGLLSLPGLAQLRKCAPSPRAGGGQNTEALSVLGGRRPERGRAKPAGGRPSSAPCRQGFLPAPAGEAPGPPGFALLINALLGKLLEERGFCLHQPGQHCYPQWHTVGIQHRIPMGLWLTFQSCQTPPGLRTPCQVLVSNTCVSVLSALVSRSADGLHNLGPQCKNKMRGSLFKND